MLFERQYILFDMGFSSLIQNENIFHLIQNEMTVILPLPLS